ncbi:MAG: M23 family metallopeptidase [Flavobacteriaceae bacterium]|nr:M23 family metallopeptidase [Flavobacteriaceae bacterium]
MIKKNLLAIILLGTLSCKQNKTDKNVFNQNYSNKIEIKNIDFDTIKKTNGFDYPVGKPNAKGYYNAQKFTENNHLGDDWNGINGGNSDLGDPIYSIANGYVSFAENVNGGWGNVIRIVHYIDKNKQVESLYAHCTEIYVKKGDYIKKGEKIGTIGNNDGQYLAHLHLELRNEVGLPIGRGYSANTQGYLNPTKFIKKNRK